MPRADQDRARSSVPDSWLPTPTQHITDQNVTNKRRILFAPLRNPAWKYRGQLKTERTKETNCVAPTRVFRFRSNCKRHVSNDLRRGENREQKQKSKIPERQMVFDTDSSKLADQIWPAGNGNRNRDSAGQGKSCRTTSSRPGGRSTLAVALVADGCATAARRAESSTRFRPCRLDPESWSLPQGAQTTCRLRLKLVAFEKTSRFCKDDGARPQPVGKETQG